MAEDRFIDGALRNVPLPAGIDGRMSASALFTDAAIDRLLADVVTPAGLAERLRVAVLDVPDAGGVVDLDRIGGRTNQSPRPGRPAAGAASRWLAALARDGGLVALSLCGIAAVFLGGMELSRRLERGSGAVVAVAARPAAVAAAPGAGPAAVVAVGPGPALGDRPATGSPQPGPSIPVPAPHAAVGDQVEVSRPAEAVAASAPAPTVRGAPLPLGASESTAALAGMRFIDMPAWTRRGVPRVRGYDLAFELTHGEAPFVDPAADPVLTIDRPPLALRTDTFDAFRLAPDRRADASGRPLRVEHVLAALPAAVVSPTTSATAPVAPRLDMHAVRSLRRVAGVQSLLVEACLTAPPLDRSGRAAGDPIDATIVLDRAVGGARLAWPWTCRALAATAAQMGPRDRLTVVVAGPAPQLALRRRGAVEVASLAADLERLSPAGFSDLDAALGMARTAANAGSRLVVVAQAGSLQRGGDDTQAALAAWRQTLGAAPDGKAAETTARFVIVDAAVADDSDSEASSSDRTAADPVALRRALLRQVFAVPTLTARQCSLAVAFNPAQVAAYRLIGHRQSVVDSLSRDPSTAIDLHAGETVRVVYEVLPRAGSSGTAGGRDLVTATLSWQGPPGAAPQQARATTGGGPDVSAALPSAHGCELLLAVGLGDIAGESAHVGRRGMTAAALAAVANNWQARGDVTPYGAVLVGCLERWAGEHRGTR